MLTKREKISLIADARHTYQNRGKPKRIAKNILTALKVIPDRRSLDAFSASRLFEGANPKK
jgi:hypothetical protein